MRCIATNSRYQAGNRTRIPGLRGAYAAGAAICLVFGLIPLLGYGIFHSGVVALLLGGAALLALSRFWNRLPAMARRTVGLLLCLGLAAAALLSALMARQAFFAPPPREEALPVVVLGGAIRGDRPSLMLARRLRAAAAYLEESPQSICVVSGGQGPDELLPEAAVMAAYLSELGVEPQRVRMEEASSNTQENMAFSKEIIAREGLNAGRAVIATDGFHQLRARIYAAHAGLESSSLSSGTPWGLAPSYWVREWMALPVAWLKVNGYMR